MNTIFKAIKRQFAARGANDPDGSSVNCRMCEIGHPFPIHVGQAVSLSTSPPTISSSDIDRYFSFALCKERKNGDNPSSFVVGKCKVVRYRSTASGGHMFLFGGT